MDAQKIQRMEIFLCFIYMRGNPVEFEYPVLRQDSRAWLLVKSIGRSSTNPPVLHVNMIATATWMERQPQLSMLCLPSLCVLLLLLYFSSFYIPHFECPNDPIQHEF
jgi:hypothetical protein